jgi:hypothetical protein
MNLGVVKRGPDRFGVVPLIQGPNGAVRGALPALDARAFRKRHIGGGGNFALDSAAYELKRPYVLNVLAHLDAPAAANALVRIERYRNVGVVNRKVAYYVLVWSLAYAELAGKGLKLAVAVSGTLKTAVGMVGEDQLQ